MPLRDHFRSPVWEQASWEGFHGMWPGTMVLELDKILPDGFSAEPRVHLGAYFEIDVCAFEGNDPSRQRMLRGDDSGNVATATWAPPKPTFEVDADLTEQYE